MKIYKNQKITGHKHSVNDPYGLVDQLFAVLESTDDEMKHEKVRSFMDSFLDYLSDTGD
ncbi:hypothetical protein [Weissella bombi]|uniref:Uncharacterized protein n=1 Tax=Weissella bombi TaxID=1505725 RepID=A0A1C4C1H3_9LACO|nr:hypothetical protein [Weissella bombi]SCC12882.1 hypothetical protein GA0061074_11920 [Weissella bombi]